jgi:hypothetical protein
MSVLAVVAAIVPPPHGAPGQIASSHWAGSFCLLEMGVRSGE